MTANAGYHAYATGDVLTAAQVQYNLQNQTVMYFADTTARDTALSGKVVEGMVSYTPATGLMYYNGTAWTSVGGSSVPTSYGFTAGKNAIINGDFSINQRSFTSTTTAGAYGFDRWNLQTDASAVTYSTQAFTAGAAPVTGYESKNFARLVTTSQTGVAYGMLQQRIEDCRTFANQTITVSFWAKAISGTPKIGVAIDQNFGSGGSSAVTTASITIPTITTSWVRYSFNVSLPTISGKTIGTSSYLGLNIVCSMTTSYNPPYPAVGLQNNTFDIWGVQVESGSTATSFQTATGTLQGELAACQRYYYRTTSGSAYGFFGAGFTSNGSSTNANVVVPLPVTMRIIPTAVDYSNVAVIDSGFGGSSCTLGLEPSETTINAVRLTATGSGLTGNRPTNIRANNNTAAYVGFTSEL